MSTTIPPRTSSRYCGQYCRSEDVHRLIEILTESSKIAVESKKPDTAQTRYELAIEAYHQILALRPGIDLEQRVAEAMQVLVDRFPSQVCMNEALGLCDKASKLKSVKSQLKYLRKAQEILERGLARQDIGYNNIKSIYDQVVVHVIEAEARIESQGR